MKFEREDELNFSRTNENDIISKNDLQPVGKQNKQSSLTCNSPSKSKISTKISQSVIENEIDLFRTMNYGNYVYF
jgi:hypothetical protein